jgi:hypothetical protein
VYNELFTAFDTDLAKLKKLLDQQKNKEEQDRLKKIQVIFFPAIKKLFQCKWIDYATIYNLHDTMEKVLILIEQEFLIVFYRNRINLLMILIGF